MRARPSLRLIAIFAALGTGAAALGAYSFTGRKWAASEVPYYVNPKNGDVSETAAIAAIQAGAMAWSAQTNASFSFYYMGKTSGSTAQYNGKNEVFFRNADEGGTIARTYWWYNSRNELLDADIMFLDGGWRFFTGTSGCSDGVYLEDIAAHEFGHALGLSHSSDTTATMYGKASRCSTQARTLAPDDVAGVEKLYPPSGSSNTAPSVTISSPAGGATYNEGTSVTLAGSASDREDGNLSSKIAWSSSRDGALGTGATLSRTLSSGSHTIAAQVTDSKGLTTSRQVSISVVASSSTNQAPVVSIAAPSDGATFPEGTSITFTGSATDAEDGNLTSKLVWKSKLDGIIGSGGSFTRVLRPGSHLIRALVTDSNGVTTRKDISITVTSGGTAPSPSPSPSPSDFWLSVTGLKIKSNHYADLSWGGASSSHVDVYRDGVKVKRTANDGVFRDPLQSAANGSYTYKVCLTGTTTCSNAALVSF